MKLIGLRPASITYKGHIQQEAIKAVATRRTMRKSSQESVVIAKVCEKWLRQLNGKWC